MCVVCGGALRGGRKCCPDCRGNTYRRYWRKQNKGRDSEASRRYELSKHGLSEAGYDSILLEQNGVCAICKEECKTGQRLVVDHDHTFGYIRGLLCRNCNRGLGLLGDSYERLVAAVEYLEV